MEWPGKLQERLCFWVSNGNPTDGQDSQERNHVGNQISVQAVDSLEMACNHKDEGQVRNGEGIGEGLGIQNNNEM